MAKPAAKVRSVEYRNYINGEWVAPSSDEYIENRNPADSRELDRPLPRLDRRRRRSRRRRCR